MIQIFGGRYAPVTFGAAFFRLPFEKIVDPYVAWVKRNHPNSKVEPCPQSLSGALDRLAPLTAPASKELLVDVDGEITAIWSNGLHRDEYSRAVYWSWLMKCEALAVTCVPDRLDQVAEGALGMYRSMQVQLLSGRETKQGESRRSVTAGNDGDRWVFFEHGSVLPFENSEKLSARRIRDRFGVEDVQSFCRYFGLPDSREPCCRRALLLHFNERNGSQRSFSYEEARADQQIAIRP